MVPGKQYETFMAFPNESVGDIQLCGCNFFFRFRGFTNFFDHSYRLMNCRMLTIEKLLQYKEVQRFEEGL